MVFQVEQAFKLVSKTNFPEKASNNQFCRYLYYTGRISALQLEYGDAHEKLKSSLRKGSLFLNRCFPYFCSVLSHRTHIYMLPLPYIFLPI